MSTPESDERSGAYAWCLRFARGHYENFPVASLLLPKAMRPHIAAIYAFARIADDFADEPGPDETERLQLLDFWNAQLDGAIGAAPPPETPALVTPASSRLSAARSMSLPVFTALRHTMRECALPPVLFRDLLSAFRQDVTVRRYATWDDVLDYCRRSANPVGRLVLRVAGHRDGRFDASSDALCTALQLTNFWQDLDRDWQKGRLYVPLADRDRAAAREADLDARRIGLEWQRVMAQMAGRTRQLFEAGRGVVDGVGGRLGWELRLTWLGGMRILDGLQRGRFDVFARRPTLSAADVPALLWGAVTWRSRRRA